MYIELHDRRVDQNSRPPRGLVRPLDVCTQNSDWALTHSSIFNAETQRRKGAGQSQVVNFIPLRLLASALNSFVLRKSYITERQVAPH